MAKVSSRSMESKDIGIGHFLPPLKPATQQLEFSSSKWVSDSILLGEKPFCKAPDFAAGCREGIEKAYHELPPRLQMPIKQLCLHLEWQELLENLPSVAVIVRSEVEMWNLGITVDGREMAPLLSLLWLECALGESFGEAVYIVLNISIASSSHVVENLLLMGWVSSDF